MPASSMLKKACNHLFYISNYLHHFIYKYNISFTLLIPNYIPHEISTHIVIQFYCISLNSGFSNLNIATGSTAQQIALFFFFFRTWGLRASCYVLAPFDYQFKFLLHCYSTDSFLIENGINH